MPRNSMSRTEINGYLAVAADPQEFTKALNSLIDGQDEKIALFLNALADAKETEPIRSHVPAVIEAALNVGDALANGGELRLGEFILDLWLVLNEQERYGVLENAVRTGKSLLGVTGMVIILGSEFGKFSERGDPNPPDRQHVTAEQLKTLEGIVLDRIHRAAEAKTLRQVPNFSLIKLAWKEWAGLNEPTAWLIDLVSTDEGLLCLLRQSMMPDSDAPEKPRFPYVRYKDALDLENIAKRFEALLAGNALSPIDRAFSASFLEYYPNFKERPQEQ